ncbi:hypothetical protein PSKAS_22220 [Peribacillus sp. N1]
MLLGFFILHSSINTISIEETRYFFKKWVNFSLFHVLGKRSMIDPWVLPKEKTGKYQKKEMCSFTHLYPYSKEFN